MLKKYHWILKRVSVLVMVFQMQNHMQTKINIRKKGAKMIVWQNICKCHAYIIYIIIRRIVKISNPWRKNCLSNIKIMEVNGTHRSVQSKDMAEERNSIAQNSNRNKSFPQISIYLNKSFFNFKTNLTTWTIKMLFEPRKKLLSKYV